MRTVFVSATREKRKEDTLLGQCFIEQSKRTGRSAELIMHCENTEKLSKIYNRYIDQTYNNAIVVFVHDDIQLNVLNTVYELENGFKKFDIIGLAGCASATIQSPALWHVMGARSGLSGAVAHQVSKNSEQIFMTPFGPYPQRCLMMDGLFLAAPVARLIQARVKFDENNPCIAHFYDLDFCLSANKSKLKMGTWPIYVTHRSHGLLSTTDGEWTKGEKWFLNKWKH